jgi:uncharacterized protein YjbI with pentapeptide repeats
MFARYPPNALQWRQEVSRHAPADLRYADLRGADLTETELNQADLRGTNLAGAKLDGAKLAGAVYDRHTRWPAGFDPRKHGAVLER